MLFCLLDTSFEVKAYKTSLPDYSHQSIRKSVKTKVVENIKSSSKASLPGSYPTPIGHENHYSNSTNTCQIGNLPGSYPGLTQSQCKVASRNQSYYSKEAPKQFDKNSFRRSPQNFKGRITIIYSMTNKTFSSFCILTLTTYLSSNNC